MLLKRDGLSWGHNTHVKGQAGYSGFEWGIGMVCCRLEKAPLANDASTHEALHPAGSEFSAGHLCGHIQRQVPGWARPLGGKSELEPPCITTNIKWGSVCGR